MRMAADGELPRRVERQGSPTERPFSTSLWRPESRPPFTEMKVILNGERWDIAAIPRQASKWRLSAEHQTFQETASSCRERATLAVRRMTGLEPGCGHSRRSHGFGSRPT